MDGEKCWSFQCAETRAENKILHESKLKQHLSKTNLPFRLQTLILFDFSQKVVKILCIPAHCAKISSMNATLTKAVLQLEPHDRLELAQLLIESVQGHVRGELELDLPEAERIDFRNRLDTAQNQPLSGRDLEGLLESVDAVIHSA
jgi:hypothetical protein